MDQINLFTRNGPIPDDRERPAQLTLIRPAGTRGLPDVYERTLKQRINLNLSANADLSDIFIASLQELIREIKRTGTGQKRYELEKGRRGGAAGDDILYHFPFTDEAELFEEAQVEIQVEGQRVEGTIVSIGDSHLTLALKENIGDEVRFAVLLIDTTALLEALKEKIEAVKQGAITLNRTLADAVVRPGQLPKPPDTPIREGLPTDSDLNDNQREVYGNALREAVTFVWGPPGTGKTKTLGEIVRSAFESQERTLICSNTNKAVDQVLYHICEALGTEHPAMKEGKIVRLGRITDDKLKAKYHDYVTVDGIVERRSADLRSQKQAIETEIAKLDAGTLKARQILAKFASLDQAKQKLIAEKENVNRIAGDGRALKEELLRNGVHRDQLTKELQRRRNAFFGFFRRKVEEIEADLAHVVAERERIEDKIGDLKKQDAAARRRFEQAQRTHDDYQSSVAGENRTSAQTNVDNADQQRANLVAKLSEVEAKITALRQTVTREAKVVGATCTKAYLSQKDIGHVDLVIIDEASMVMRPMAWFSAGLAAKRVVISGDFCQIPPIVQTEEEAIFDALGRDPFTATERAKYGAPDLMMLTDQHRMHSEICDLISKPMYEGRLSTAAGRETVEGQSPPEPFDRALTIIDTSALSPFESQNAFFSRFNMLHALLARNLVWHLQQEGVIGSPLDLGICTPYAAQARLIQKLLEGDGLDEFVHAGTVHRFQGDERRMVLLEIPESRGGFWALGQFVQGVPPTHVGARLINVAVSRAQEHLVVLANLTYLDRRLPSHSLLRSILHDMQQRGRIVPGEELLELRPIASDLAGLVGQAGFDDIANSVGIFDEMQFERGLAHDIQSAEETVVLFSGYITPTRVAKLGDLLRSKILKGIKVRCVTRPPRANGSIPVAAGREAVEMLSNIGVVVDFRANIHQKVCLIDNRIVWWGSLNALSHMGRADEMMTRTVNEGFAKMVAAHMSKRPVSAEKSQATVAERENPLCEDCDAYSVFKEGRHGSYFDCESHCGWSRGMKEVMRQQTNSHGPSNKGRHEPDLAEEAPTCPDCAGKTRLRRGRYGPFYGCMKYPACRGIVNI